MHSVDKGDGYLRILDEIMEINKNNPQISKDLRFNYIVHDIETVTKLKRLIGRINLNLPVLIEGKTGSSKTSMIEYLGYLSNNKVVKINLSALTDTSDLIGKFIPNDGFLSKEDLDFDLLNSDKSKEIFKKCEAQNRDLSKHESLIISKQENISIPEWKWLHGVIPQAMINGYWVILDEINLANPSILERLNSVLELEPSLRLTEYNNLLISRYGDINISENFRIFGTMNPLEYVGRNEFSDAYFDRWQGYIYFDDVNKKGYYDMLMYLITGLHPEVYYNNFIYASKTSDNHVFNILSNLTNIGLFISKLVELHIDIGIKKDKEHLNYKSRIILTRRTLISVISFMARKIYYSPKENSTFNIEKSTSYIIKEALIENYVLKAQDETDKEKIMDTIEMNGILGLDIRVDSSSSSASDNKKTLATL